jgi:hypothetical protein
MKETIGYCSLCGGEVRREMGPWGSIFPPIASCSKCGATESKGPVIPMVPNRSREHKQNIMDIRYSPFKLDKVNDC